jgi:hypothetical protein
MGARNGIQSQLYKGLAILGLGVGLAACQPGSQQENLSKVDAARVSKLTTVFDPEFELRGPQVVFENVEAQYEILIPQGDSLSQLVINNSQNSQGSSNPTSLVFDQVGNAQVAASFLDSTGNSRQLIQEVQVLPLYDELLCAMDLSIRTLPVGLAGEEMDFEVLIPQCLARYSPRVSWTFGDGSSGSGNVVSHTFRVEGDYTVRAVITLSHPRVSTLNLSKDVIVLSNQSNPNECSQEGQTRQTETAQQEESLSCGVLGTQKNIFKFQVTEQCSLQGEVLKWTEVSRERISISEGSCEAQACAIPSNSLNGIDAAALGLVLVNGAYYLPHNSSMKFFSSSRPEGSCDEVSQVRSCNNGVLSGTDFYSRLSCISGCEGFGADGTVRSGVVVGSEQVQRQCSYGEVGIFDTVQILEDQRCEAGSVVNSNTRRGDAISVGSCPTYSWVGTDNFTTCTADCGGNQNRLFVCQNNFGEPASEERCTETRPTESRLCDGNPDAVKRTEQSVIQENAGASMACPSNQIGTIVQYREVTITQNYACINHSVQLESENRAEGAWIEERYCRDFVAKRCNHDSLSITQAKGRYDWMVKCQDQVPAIKEFLVEFENVSVKNQNSQWTLNGKGRLLYPTFMQTVAGKEKIWIAPRVATASCDVPSNIYVAAVCVASCATPEQKIIVGQNKKDGKKEITFIEALTQNFPLVATLHDNSRMNSDQLRLTAVDQWVSEVADSEHSILNFTMKSGGTLRITTNHPLLDPSGRMKVANDFKVGDSLVKLGGQSDEIVSIVPEVYFGKVYNVFVKSKSLHQNIVVTNGYLNGTALFQNEGASHMNRNLFRREVLKGAYK